MVCGVFPLLDIAMQGLTEKEVKENMEDLINGFRHTKARLRGNYVNFSNYDFHYFVQYLNIKRLRLIYNQTNGKAK